MIVQVSAKTIRVPFECACCGGVPDTEVSFAASRTTGKRVVKTTTRSFDFPYCNSCVQHARLANTGAGYLFGVLVLFALLGAAFHPVAAVLMLVGAIAIPIWHHTSRMKKARELMGGSCACAHLAGRYLGWNGSIQTFDFASRDYALSFMSKNSAKLINVPMELVASLKAAAPQKPTSTAGSNGSKTARPEPSEHDTLLRWLEKLEGLKSPAARRAAIERGLEELRSNHARERLKLEASRIGVRAVLDKVDELKSAPAKRRNLEQAIQEIEADDIPDELQAEELRQLREALVQLTSP